MFDKVLPEGYLPKTYLRGMGGLLYTSDYSQVERITLESLLSLLKNSERMVVKPTVGSSSGRGVEVFSLKNGRYINLHTEEALDENYIKNHYKGDFIIQEALVQASEVSAYNPTSINTLRLLVYKSVKDNKSRVINAALRVGKKGSHLDNAHAGGVIVGVDEKGRLGQYCVNQYGEVFDEVNDVLLKGQEHIIPEWGKVVSFACEVANCVLHHRLLSMDVALCKEVIEGRETIVPKLIEYNLSSLGTWCWQFTNKSVYNDYTDEILDYCLKKNPTKAFMVRN